MTNKENRKTRIAKRRARSARRQGLSPEEQRRRDIQKDINRQLRGWTPRRRVAWSFFVLAGVVAVQHIIAHMGVAPLPLGMGWQDLLIGYPMALLLLVVGAVVLEPYAK